MNYLSKNRLAAWNPLSELRTEMDRVFDDFWPSAGLAKGAARSSEGIWNPICEVEEADQHYLINLEMPGVSKDQVKIEFHDNQILISGERKDESKRKEGNYWYSERKFGKFQRAFTLPVGVDADRVEAKYQDGVLKIFIPKAESAKPRQIKISNDL